MERHQPLMLFLGPNWIKGLGEELDRMYPGVHLYVTLPETKFVRILGSKQMGVEYFEGQVGTDQAPGWYYRIRAANGEKLSVSEQYVSKSNAKRGYRALLEAVHADVLAELRAGTLIESDESKALAGDYASPSERNADMDVAIGEHAFRAGWYAREALPDVGIGADEQLPAAWSSYDPPEELKGGSDVQGLGTVAGAVAAVSAATAAVETDKRRGRR